MPDKKTLINPMSFYWLSSMFFAHTLGILLTLCPLNGKKTLRLIGARERTDFGTTAGENQVNEGLSKIIRQAMAGDKASFEKLVCRYKQHIINIAFGILGNPHDAEEIAQETFLKAYLSIGNLKNENAFYRWLVKIATNLSINKKNVNAKQSTQPFEETEALPANPGQTPEAVLEQKEKRRLIMSALSRLTPEQRAVIVLRQLQGFSYDEIAQILDIPLGTVKSRINTARARLCENLSCENL